MKLTVRKADGPGWLMIAETVENGTRSRYGCGSSRGKNGRC
ncbi:hypothetical protein [Brevibacillus sp. LEMMJ03]|nr:hypothetical protein [Brevibacillus sp. LEMMJ03]